MIGDQHDTDERPEFHVPMEADAGNAAVADAIVRKLLHEQKMTGVEHKRGQAECS